MKIPTNTFKAGLKSGSKMVGCWCSIAETAATEIVAHTGYDWMVIDNEHSANDLRSTLDQLRVVDASDSAAVVRIPWGDHVQIKQMLDMGVQTILVPMVETAEQARELVAAMYYPPKGIRGVGSMGARASRWSAVSDYFQTAEAELCLIVQVETKKGLENLEEIAAVDGVDAVFFGPSDIAADFGMLGQVTDPVVKNAVLEGIETVNRIGKSAAGTLMLNPDLAKEAFEKGASFVAVSLDSITLAKSLRELRAKFD